MAEKTIKLFLKALIYGLLINIGLQLIAEPTTFSLDAAPSQVYHLDGQTEFNFR